jgi:hypothetical protein
VCIAIVTNKLDDQRYHRPMSENPPGGTHFGGLPAGHGPSSSTVPPAAPSYPGRWPMLALLLIALLGVGVGVAAWLRPIPGSKLSGATAASTEQHAGEAKMNICHAYTLVTQVVTANTHRTNPAPGDAVGALATGIYGPVSLYVGGDYLSGILDDEPTTPADLSRSIKSLSKTLKQLAMVDLAGQPESVRNSLRDEVNSHVRVIDGLCR